MGEQILDAENASSRMQTVDDARDTAIRRLFTSDERRVPTERDQRGLTALNDMAIELGTVIGVSCPDGREKNMAWTALEDCLIRARRAIFGAIS